MDADLRKRLEERIAIRPWDDWVEVRMEDLRALMVDRPSCPFCATCVTCHPVELPNAEELP